MNLLWRTKPASSSQHGQAEAMGLGVAVYAVFYGTMLSKNSIMLPKTPSALCRVFVPAVVRLRMLRMSPGAVLSSGG